MSQSIQQLQALVEAFLVERNWVQFHTQKETATAMAIEAAELQDLYLWNRVPGPASVEDEFGDVMVFALSFASRSGIDIAAAVTKALAKASKKYPVEKAYGSNAKYNQLDSKATRAHCPVCSMTFLLVDGLIPWHESEGWIMATFEEKEGGKRDRRCEGAYCKPAAAALEPKSPRA